MKSLMKSRDFFTMIVLFFFIFGCGSAEDRASNLFNEAIIDAKNSRPEEALNKVDKLLREYPGTKVALYEAPLALSAIRKQFDASAKADIRTAYVALISWIENNNYNPQEPCSIDILRNQGFRPIDEPISYNSQKPYPTKVKLKLLRKDFKDSKHIPPETKVLKSYHEDGTLIFSMTFDMNISKSNR